MSSRFITIPLTGRVPGGAGIEFVQAYALAGMRSPLLTVTYARNGIEPQYGLRLDMDKRVFLDHFDDPREENVAKTAISDIIEIAMELRRESRNYPNSEKSKANKANTSQRRHSKIVIGLFDSFADAKNAIRELTHTGFSHEDVGFVANYSDDTSEFGYVLVPISGFGFPLAVAGWMTDSISNTGIGGLTGSLIHMSIPEEEARIYNEGIRRGGTIVSVRTQDADANRAANVLSQHRAINIDERGAQYRQLGFLVGEEVANVTGTAANAVKSTEGSIPGVQTGGHALDGTPDTRGILEKATDTLTDNRSTNRTSNRT